MSFFPNHDGKGNFFVNTTWLSHPGPIPDDLPDEFDLDDFDSQPDYEGAERAHNQKEILTKWVTQED